MVREKTATSAMNATFGQRCAEKFCGKYALPSDIEARLAAVIDAELLGDSAPPQMMLDGGEEQAAERGKKIPPHPDEVRAFCAQIGAKFTPEAFCDFYEQRGWMVGRVKMKNWHAAARQWHREGWGMERMPAGLTVNLKPLTEWERKQKIDRLRDVRTRLRDLHHPGGSAYPVTLTGAKLEVAAGLSAQIAQLKIELGETS